MLLRARCVAPIARPPLNDGAVRVVAGTLRTVGRWRDLAPQAASEPVHDLGEVLLLPGLVNPHCHLDYTDMAGLLPRQPTFPDWIKAILGLKAEWALDDYQRSWQRGTTQLLRTGVTTVGDIEAVPELLPAAWETTPLRVCSFLEMTGIRARRAPAEVLAAAVQRAAALPRGRCQVGLSPHAPYSTTPELLRLSRDAARTRGWRLAMHLAESAEEWDMFTRGAGVMFDWLQHNERDMTDCGAGSPVRHLEACGVLGPDLVAVHVNYLAAGDAALLAERGVSVVHCPRSHAYFGHDPFPRRALHDAGVNVCLGTDSLASVARDGGAPPALSLFDELQTALQAQPALDPATAVREVTLQAARALGLEGRAGALVEGAWADVIALPFTGDATQVDEAIAYHRGDVRASMIGGQWVWPPPS